MWPSARFDAIERQLGHAETDDVRRAYGLAAARGSILLAAGLILYWAYDRIVGIDNVKLG